MEPKDELLWQVAKKRAAFKKHAASYVIVNIFLWAVWFFSTRPYTDEEPFPWPIWVMVFWGIGLAFNYADAYLYNAKDATEREYEKLKRGEGK
jgi:hypothetical protein